MIIYSNREHKYLKDRKVDSLLASICFEVQRGSREDFVWLGHNRRKIKIIQDDWYKMIGTGAAFWSTMIPIFQNFRAPEGLCYHVTSADQLLVES